MLALISVILRDLPENDIFRALDRLTCQSVLIAEPIDNSSRAGLIGIGGVEAHVDRRAAAEHTARIVLDEGLFYSYTTHSESILTRPMPRECRPGFFVS